VFTMRRLTAVSPSHLLPLKELNIPVLVTGLQEHWAARREWTPDLLQIRYGETSVPVRVYAPGSDLGYTTTTSTLAAFLEYWRSTKPDVYLRRERRYLAEWNFTRSRPDLLKDFSIPHPFAYDEIDLLPEQLRFGRMWLFFGEPGCGTGLHRDTFSTSAWLAVVQGTKLLRLVEPSVHSMLQPGDSLWDDRTCRRLASQAGAEVVEAELTAGRTLYIPGNWYHEIRNPERNIMVTANFLERCYLLSFLAQFEARLTEPLSSLRDVRNTCLRQRLAGAGDSADSPEVDYQEQLEWVDAALAPLLDFRRLLLADRSRPELSRS
jgi:hypothetical protein